jgi:membrane-bound serine protease (ClpP class)
VRFVFFTVTILAMKKLIIALLVAFSSLTYSNDYEVDRIHQLEINSSINPATFNYLSTNFKKIKTNDLVLIKLNTPGGLVSTTKEILTLIGEASFPVVIWVTPEGASATSAGAIIASAAHVLFMSEGTNIGAATPIGLGKDIKESDARSKAINDLVALVTSLSKARGRNAEGFAEMIEDAASFDSQEAKDNKLIDDIVSSFKGLKKKLNDRDIKIKGKSFKLKVDEVELVKHDMDIGQNILNIFANPTTAYILFLLGAALLYVEFQAAGGFIAGALGAVSLILAGIGFQVLPLNIGALALIVLAFILFVMEMYITSYGILSIGGVVALISGSLFLYRTDDSFLALKTSIIISTVVSILAFMGVIAYALIKDARKKKPNFFVPVDETGTVMKFLKEEGDKKVYQIKVYGEIWNATCIEELQDGDQVKVIKEDQGHLRLVVEKV